MLTWLARPTRSIRAWELWSAPIRVRRYVLAVELLVLLTTVGSTMLMPIHRSDWLVFGVLAACTVAHIELTRGIERTRSATTGASPYMNTDAVWCVAAVLALPTGLACAIVTLAFVWSWLRVMRGRRPLYRWVFSGATVLLATQVAAAIVLIGPGHHPGVTATALGLGVAAAAGALRWFINFALVVGAIVISSPNIRAAQIFDGIGERVLEIGAFALGVVAAYLALNQPVLLICIALGVLAMHRSVLLAQLRKDAHTDGKTGLHTANWWHDLAHSAFERARAANDVALAVLILDLDHFKDLNDTYGHLAGDEVLRAVGQMLRAEVRDHDQVGRWGGEEFAILLVGVDESELRGVAERIRLRIHDMTVTITGLDGPTIVGDLAVSIGGARYPAPGVTALDELLLAADGALYQAKQRGRNRFCLNADPATGHS
ncbi:MAG TPA: GGDEF domain-containing protein [Pseudonocardiaceae bacterium]|nr:GGDEF domain-containing protein [Pseudonocardiaceae bacterium]